MSSYKSISITNFIVIQGSLAFTYIIGIIIGINWYNYSCGITNVSQT